MGLPFCYRADKQVRPYKNKKAQKKNHVVNSPPDQVN